MSESALPSMSLSLEMARPAAMGNFQFLRIYKVAPTPPVHCIQANEWRELCRGCVDYVFRKRRLICACFGAGEGRDGSGRLHLD